MTSEGAPSSGICVVTAGGPYPWIIINALGKEFGPIDVVLEEPEPRGLFLKRRARKIGWLATTGQFATMVLVRLGKKRFAKRIERIVAENGLEEEPKPEHPVTNIDSINSQAFLKSIERIDPRAILLVGCRIAKPEILAAIKVPVYLRPDTRRPGYRRRCRAP